MQRLFYLSLFLLACGTSNSGQPDAGSDAATTQPPPECNGLSRDIVQIVKGDVGSEIGAMRVDSTYIYVSADTQSGADRYRMNRAPIGGGTLEDLPRPTGGFYGFGLTKSSVFYDSNGTSGTMLYEWKKGTAAPLLLSTSYDGLLAILGTDSKDDLLYYDELASNPLKNIVLRSPAASEKQFSIPSVLIHAFDDDGTTLFVGRGGTGSSTGAAGVEIFSAPLAGGNLTSLVKGDPQDGIQRLAVDDTYVYFTTPYSVGRVKKTGEGLETLQQGSFLHTDIVLSWDRVFWVEIDSTPVTGHLMSMKKDGTDPQIVVGNLPQRIALADDACFVYWTSGADNRPNVFRRAK